MKLFLKAITLIMLLKGFLFADYVSTKEYNIFFKTTKPVEIKDAEIKEVFFGVKEQFNNNLMVANAGTAAMVGGNMLSAVAVTAGGMASGIASGGVGMFFNYLKQKGIEQTTPLQMYYVVDIKDKNGVEAKGVAVFMSNEKKYKEPNEENNEETLKEIYNITKGVFTK